MMETNAGNIRDPLNIVFLLQDLEFGGTQRYTIHLLKHLDRDLFNPKLWVLCGRPDMASLAMDAGVEPVWMSKTSWVGPHSVAALAKHLIKYPPQVLYTLTPVPNIWGRLFGTMARVPAIISSWRGMYPNQYESLMWRLSARIICNASVLKRIIMERHGVPADRISVVRNGVNAEFYAPDHAQKSPTPLVVYVGRLVRDKDPLTMIEAFRIVAEKMPSVQFEMIGDGYLRDTVEKSIARYGLQDRIALLPGQLDTRPNLRRAWVFAMSSAREASPNVILEAMASELPVVAPRVGGIPELVQDNDTGSIVEPGNPEALAAALTELIENPVKRAAMGAEARARVLKFHGIERMVKETERIILEAVAERMK